MLSEIENHTLIGLVFAKAHEGMFSGGATNAMGFSGETIEQTCRVAARNIAQQTSVVRRGSMMELVLRNNEMFEIENYTGMGMLGLNRSNGYYG